MRNIGTFWMLLVIWVGGSACVSKNADSTVTTGTIPASDTVIDQSVKAPVNTLTSPTCTVDGEVLDGNKEWVANLDILAVIKGEGSTEGIGSHNILKILAGRTCEVLHSTKLPTNFSPDYPYYLAEPAAKDSLLLIQGYQYAFVCDLANNYQLSPLEPTYFSERNYDDTQSGMIQHLEIWKDYILGFAADCGPFIFDCRGEPAPTSVVPFAEWKNQVTGRYHSLFLLETEEGTQALMPDLNSETGAFTINILFEIPQQVSLNVPRSARNNRLFILRTQDAARTAIAINLQARKVVELPENLREASTQVILEWVGRQ